MKDTVTIRGTVQGGWIDVPSIMVEVEVPADSVNDRERLRYFLADAACNIIRGQLNVNITHIASGPDKAPA